MTGRLLPVAQRADHNRTLQERIAVRYGISPEQVSEILTVWYLYKDIDALPSTRVTVTKT